MYLVSTSGSPTKFELKLRKRNIPKEELLSDLTRVAELIKQNTVTAAVYTEKEKFGVNTFSRRFGSWNKALDAAGLKVVLNLNIKEEMLFENLADIWQHLGRQPVGKDLEKSFGYSKYSLGTYEKRFGSWNKALVAFIGYINAVDNVFENQSKTKISKKIISRSTQRKINWRLRAKILIRDNCICKMCGRSPAKDPSVVLHVDHIKAWANGGETVLENLQTLCSKCNIGKSDME